ncbi:hypothetical protein [Streptomyces siamensis]|uniref:Uncharacterized protein n=1 Tax=Streptomyces siamensis TaxID=1274986 RepID=A0ABP9II09_9ACTN
MTNAGASGGYVPYAAQTEHRIKAVATVSGAEMGALFREGLGGGQSEDVIRDMLDQAGRDRPAEARGEKPRLEHVAPETEADAEGWPTLYQEGRDHTAEHPGVGTSEPLHLGDDPRSTARARQRRPGRHRRR